MFRTVPLSIIRSFFCLLTSCEQNQDGTAVPSWSCSQAVCKHVWHIPLLCVQRKTPDDGQRNCPKHVKFHSKSKFWEICASSWFDYKNFITIHSHVNVKVIPCIYKNTSKSLCLIPRRTSVLYNANIFVPAPSLLAETYLFAKPSEWHRRFLNFSK